MINHSSLKTYEEMTNFNKTLFGFKKKEVYEHIDLLNDNLNKAKLVFEEKLAELRSENELLSHEKSKLQEALHNLERTHKAMASECETMREFVNRQDEITEAYHRLKEENKELAKENASLTALAEENYSLKKAISESEALNVLHEQQYAEFEAEILSLHEKNKAMLAEFIDEKAALVAEINEKNMTLSQRLKMHSYTLSKSRDALEALLRQFEQSCQIASEIKVD